MQRHRRLELETPSHLPQGEARKCARAAEELGFVARLALGFHAPCLT
jgi:hypothetical protein